MNTEIGLERCLSFINCHLKPPSASAAVESNRRPRRAITLSRQAGAGGDLIALRLVEILQEQSSGDDCPWTVFDRNLVEKVLDEHRLPSRLARFMPEDRTSGIADTMDELFGLHPPSSTLVHKTAETILHLAELGNVILLGRGANVITATLDHVFHVRVVGSFEKRVSVIQELLGFSKAAAARLVADEDRGRKRYLKKYFGKDIDDPLLYHLVLNTDWIPFEEAARLIATAVLEGRPVRR